MDEGMFGPEGDVWAAGMLMAELISQRVPFASCDTHVSLSCKHGTLVRMETRVTKPNSFKTIDGTTNMCHRRYSIPHA